MDTLDIENQSGTPRSIFLPVALGLGACLLAVIAIVFSLGAKSKHSQVYVQLHAAQAQLAAFESRLNALDASSDELSAMDDAMMKQMQSMADQVQTAFNQLSQEVVSQSEVLDKLKHAAPVLQVARQAKNPEKTISIEHSGVHAIQSGDTFGRLAQIYGIPISQLLGANPSVDPKRLQIGQQVVIPQKSK